MKNRIEICGGVGVGKTTLCTALSGFLSQHSFAPILESYATIPFWEYCLRSPGQFEFERDFGFLLHHANLICSAFSGQVAVCDFSLLDDLTYAKHGLCQSDYAFVEILYDRLISRAGNPNLILHLSCPLETQFERIVRRNRPNEQGLTRTFISEINLQIQNMLADYQAQWDKTRPWIIEVDTSSFDLPSAPGDLPDHGCLDLIRQILNCFPEAADNSPRSP